MAKRSSTQSWLITLGIGAGIAVAAVKFQDQIKEAVKDVPYLGDWVNS